MAQAIKILPSSEPVEGPTPSSNPQYRQYRLQASKPCFQCRETCFIYSDEECIMWTFSRPMKGFKPRARTELSLWMMGCLVVNQLRLGISGPGLPVKFTSVSFPRYKRGTQMDWKWWNWNSIYMWDNPSYTNWRLVWRSTNDEWWAPSSKINLGLLVCLLILLFTAGKKNSVFNNRNTE